MSLAQQRLKSDATNRATRTFVQGLYVDLGVAIAVFVLANIASADLTNSEAMQALGLSFVKTLLTSLASYVVRLYGDKSKMPTGPLPPEDPGPPAEEVTPSPPITAVEENDTDTASENQDLVDADANVRLIQAQVDLTQAQGARREQAERVAEAAKKRAPRKAPAKRVTPLEEIRQEAKKPTVAKKAPTPRKKQP